MQYSTLKTKVAAFLNRSSTDIVTEVPTFIGLAAEAIQDVLNLKGMECTSKHVFAVPASAAYRGEGYKITTPYDGSADWTAIANPFDSGSSYKHKAFRQAWVYNSSDEKRYRLVFLEKHDFERVVLTSDTTQICLHIGDILARDTDTVEGTPLVICQFGDEYLLYPRTSSAGVGQYMLVDFFGRVDYSAVADAYEDWLLTNGWRALLYGALLEAVPYLGKIDARKEEWQGLHNDALAKLNILSVSIDNVAVRV